MRRTLARRAPVVVLAAALSVSVLAATAGPVGAAAGKAAVGTLHCTVAGNVNFSPKLTATRHTTKLKISATMNCTEGTTGMSGVTVVSGTLSAKTGRISASCASTAFGSGTARVTWGSVGGAVAPSKMTWSSATATDGTNIAFDLHGPGGREGGSYAGRDLRLHVVGDAVSGGLCGGGAQGFSFTGAGGASTLDLQAPNPHNLPIQHVIVLMQENRSADTYLGQLNSQGQPAYEAEPNTGNPDPTNPLGTILPFHKTNYCEVADLNHSWNGTHAEWDGGAMDGFTAQNVVAADPTGSRAMGYYDQTDLPFYYALHSTFATGDRYFSSALTQTFPNRLYLLAGTSFGHIRNDAFGISGKSVFELLDAAGVTWRIYAAQPAFAYGPLFFKYVSSHAKGHVFPVSQYYVDLANGNLSDVSYIDPTVTDPPGANDEHPPANVQVGQKFVADAINGLMGSSSWATSAFFLTYDEHGGFYDHVAPPAAPVPDNIPPMLQPGDSPGAFDRYGMRVPAVVVSPYSKPGFVSHVVHDHTSILRFIENRFGLPSLTNRDANADPMLEFFDFNNAAFATPPALPAAVVNPAQATCNG